MKHQFFFILLISLYFSSDCLSQVELSGPVSQAVILDLDDGSVIYGIISNKTEYEISVQSASLGSVTVPITSISKIRYIDDVRNIIFDKNGNPVDFHNSTHYFLFPSGYSLKKGQSYYENIWVFANSYSYGVTDNFTISVGGEIASLLFASQVPLLYASPKLSVPLGNQKGALGLSSTFIILPGDDFNGAGFLSGSLTVGSRNNNFTLGAGAGFNFDGGITDEIIPFTFSFMKRMGSKLSLISENWVVVQNDFADSFGIASLGLRIHFKELGNALNVGLARPLTGDTGPFIALPFISATVGINK